MQAEELVIDGPQVLVPGSDFLVLGLVRLLFVVGLLALVVAVVVRLVRRRRATEPLGPPVSIAVCGALAVLGLVLSIVHRPPPFFVPEFPALPVLQPEDSVLRRTAADLPVSADSDRWIASQDGMELRANFRGTVTEGVVWGVPFNLVDEATPRVDVELTQYPETSFPGPYPMTDPAYIEGLPTYHFDQHYVAVDVETRQVWELIATRNWFGRWQAGAGANWSMDSVDYPTGSTIVAGLPLLAGTITYPEVASGSIEHVILGSSWITAVGQHVWPARNTDGRSNDPDAPPMGAWLRLKADADLSGLGPQARVIAEATRRYGIVLSDTGPGFNVRGTVDARWDAQDLRSLSQLTADDFEVVDPSSVMVSPDSMAVRPPA